MTEHRLLSPLTRKECLALMDTASIGRVVYTERALPAVEIAAFCRTEDTVALPVPAGPLLRAAVGGSVLGFQTDSYDDISRTGWSVLVTGRSWAVTDPDEIAWLTGLLDAERTPAGACWIRIHTGIVRGVFLPSESLSPL